MWGIIFILSVTSLMTLTNGQQVVDPPRIVNFPTKDLLAPEDVKFSRQNALKLPCDAVGSNLKWTWKHNGTAVTTGVKFTVGADGTLYGSYLESTQSGNYQCFVRDTVTGIETFSRKIQVAVTVVGSFTNQNEQEVLVDLGEEFSYDCPQHSPSYGVSYSWQGKITNEDIQFKRNDRRAISQTGQLLIMYVTQQDIDDFAKYDRQGIRCFMTGANRFESSGILKLKKKNAGQIDPGTPRAPAWKLIPAAIETAVGGRNKTLYCLAVGRPVPTITWKMQDESGNWQNLVHGQDSFEIDTAFQGRLLNIISVKQNMHETRYRCEAENSQSGGNPLVHDIHLNVEVAPRFLASPPKQVEIDNNGNGSLTCDVFADPSPSFKWYKNGKQLTTSTVQVILNGNKLVFKNVRYPNEIGVYQCVAENPHGMVVSSTYVKVLATKPSFAESGFGPFYLFRGTVGRLTCNPSAAPRATKDQYKWYKGTTLLTSSPPYRIEHGELSTLIIDNVDKNRDEGLYKCYAENFLSNSEATATATVFERTIIVVRPRDQSIDEGTHVDLRCEATADPSLELRYYWKKDNAVITYNNKTQWLEGAKVLTIANLTVDEAGNYTCVAYTSGPIRSEDQASATIDVSGAPYPPTNLAITNCFNRTTTLSWVTGAANNASITHFIIEQESSHEPNVFYNIKNVTNPNATSFSFNLTGWATLRFRMRAVNRFGPSRASVATSKVCRTDVGPPDKYPDHFRGNPMGAGYLDILWTAMPKVDWNAPGLYYLLKYREVPGGQFGDPERITDPAVDVFAIPNPGYYKLWEFQIRAGNDVDLGPESPVVQSYSGQDPPEGKPGNVQTGGATARTVELSWQPVTVTRGSVNGYKIYYSGESRVSERRRREIPGDAMFVNVPGGSKKSHTVTKLTPYTNYNFSITAYNEGGEGPVSDEAFATTDEAEPGPPSQVNVYAFAKYIMVRWKAPVEPNGVITKYRVRSAQYEGSQPSDDLQVSWQEFGPGVFRKLLDNQTPERNHVVEIQAQTSKGWGDKVRNTTRTVAYAPPAKPARPTAEGITVDKVRVTYKFGLGGGYTHEFLVMYRRKLEGEAFKNTSWVNHFETQSIEIGGLNNELYEFKTVGRNDYPDNKLVNSRSESPASDVTEGRPLRSTTKPGPPSQVNVYAFAKYIMVTWKAPVEPNGVITKYRVRSAPYEGSQPSNDLQVSWQEVGAGVFRKLLDNQTPERNYLVEIQAQTSKGLGEQVRNTTRTVAYAPPAKPARPTAEGKAVDKVRVTYKFGLGGGYTHEFLVMYRRKLEGEAFQNTSWVNHFETQSIEIEGLNNELYEFKTVGRNDYPDNNNVNSRSESPASDVTEGRPLPSTKKHGLQCYHCVSTKSWDDCASIQKKVACDSGKETCANIHYHSKSGDLAMSEERYARKCSAKSACGNEELCKALAPKGATIKKCKVNCCEGNLCNGARVPLASAILLLACALSAFFCSESANCEVLSF